MKKCCICGKYINGWGNNPYPYGRKRSDECCDECNKKYVIPARLNMFFSQKKNGGDKK